MLKGAYILYEDIHENISGVNKKILTQINMFRCVGFDIKEVKQIFPSNMLTKLTYRLPGLSPKWTCGKELENFDFIYLRRPYFMSGKFISFLKKVKQNGTRIILEIPTYPYDEELKHPIKLFPFYLKDKYYRGKLVGLIDRIVTLTNDKKIYGIETLCISNGYDFSQTPLRKIEINDSIDLCCVALFEPWHGYERLIEGLNQYKMSGGDRKIILHFVGDGPELPRYQKLVKKYNLEDSSIFYGMKSPEELSDIYNKCDFGVTSLGAYKKGLYFLKALKSREYLATGLPMIIGCKLDFSNCSELSNYILEYPNDNSYIDFRRIIHCYDRLYNKVHDVQRWASDMRNFGINHFGMEESMKEVIEYLKNEV